MQGIGSEDREAAAISHFTDFDRNLAQFPEGRLCLAFNALSIRLTVVQAMTFAFADTNPII